MALIGVGGALALALASPAGAEPAYSETFTDTATDAMSCDGFDADMEHNFDVRATVFLDKSGDPVRLRILARVSGSLTNSETGDSLPLHGHVLFVFDFVAGTDSFVGPVFIVTKIGAGSVVKDVGRIVFQGNELVFEAGPHEAIDTDGEILCAALAA